MNYFQVYKDVWEYHKRFANVRNDDQYWTDVADQCDMLAKKYSECKFAIDLLLAVVAELERVAKEKINGI